MKSLSIPNWNFRVLSIFKLLLSVFLFLSYPFLLFAQPQNTLREVGSPAPTVASLGKYADIPVSHHTGVPNISLPLYAVKDGDLVLNITLDYHSSGVKVEEIASWVGLGWSVNAGGMITRTIIGAPDEGNQNTHPSPRYSITGGEGWFEDNGLNPIFTDYPVCISNPNYLVDPNDPGGPTGHNLDPNSCYAHYLDAGRGNIDTEPDIFTFNFNGYSGKFIFNESRQVHVLPDQDLKIEPLNYTSGNFDSWRVTTPDGTKYYFGGINAKETVYSDPDGLGAILDDYRTSTTWYLTRIESHDGSHWINFTYVPEKYSFPDRLSHSGVLSNTCVPQPTYGLQYGPVGLMVNSVNGYRLNQITTSKGYATVDFIATTLRQDVTKYRNIYNNNEEAKRLEQIKITSGAWIKYFDFSYSYFQSTAVTGTDYDLTTLTDKKRLRLDQVQERGGSVTLPPYQFAYNPQAIGRRLSWGRDHWGYYNGADQNVGLIPNFTAPCDPSYPGSNQTGLANRAPNEEKMKACILEEITYPTGGKTKFIYEAHKENPNSPNIVGGLRVKQITDTDGMGGVPVVRNFEYSTGILYAGNPQYVFNPNSNPLLLNNNIEFLGYLVNSSPNPPMRNTQGYHIGYSVVHVVYPDNAKSTYRYNNLIPTPNYYYPPAPTQQVMGSGTLHKEEHYNAENNLVREVAYTYLIETDNLVHAKKVVVNNIFDVPGCGGPQFPADPVCRLRVVYAPYSIPLGRVLLTQKQEQTDGVTTTMTYEYSLSRIHLNPIAENVNNSDGKIHRSEYDFAHEASNNYMITAYMVGIPIKMRRKVNGATVGGYEKTYTNGYPTLYKEILPGGSTLTRSTIGSYSGGYPNTFTSMGFPSETYTWQNGKLTARDYLDWDRSYSYYPQSLFLKEAVEIDDQTTEYTYDGLGRLSSITSRQGRIKTSFTYIYGLPSQVITKTVYETGPPQTKIEEFDGLGRIIRNRHNGVVKHEFVYDARSRVFKETYLPGNFVTYLFDNSPLNRVVKTIMPDGNATETLYGSEGNYYKITVIDEKGNETDQLTDILGRQYKTRNAIDGETTFQYTDPGNVERVIPPTGDHYVYTYDSRNRMDSKTIPGGGTMRYRYYDANDLLKYTIDANNNRVDYIYDVYGRELQVLLATQVSGEGTPGAMIKENTYGESSGGILTGKLLSMQAKMFGASTTFTQTIYGYDLFGRVEGQQDNYTLDGIAMSDVYLFGYNDADWLSFTSRVHSGPQSVTTNSVYHYDEFGREIIQSFGSNAPYAAAVAKTWNDRDELIVKKLGSVGGIEYLDRILYRYNERGWVTEMNRPKAELSDKLTCDNSLTPPEEFAQIEEEVTLNELLELISRGEDVVIPELDPCSEAICYEELASYTVIMDYKATAKGVITAITALDSVLPLPNYPYVGSTPQGRLALENDLKQWLTANGYLYESVAYEVFLTTRGEEKARLRILQTNLRFNKVASIENQEFRFDRYNVKLVLCKNLKGTPTGDLSQQAASLAQLDAFMNSRTLTGFPYPNVLYQVILANGAKRWVFRDELHLLKGPYTRTDRIHISNANQTFTVTLTNNTKVTKNMTQLLADRNSGTVVKVSPNAGPQPPPECDLEPLGCTPLQEEQQQLSVAQILSAMAGLDVFSLTLPINLYLVQLCDGSTMYILGDALLSQLEGPHLVLDQLQITHLRNRINVVIRERKPLFSMSFQYEPNGNIEKARWKVTNRNIKFYTYAYDPLNRLVDTHFGEEFLVEDPPGALNYLTSIGDTYRSYGFQYDPIGNIQALNRYGAIPDPTECLRFGIIDQLSYTYGSGRLQEVKDNAPAEFRDYGFKENSSAPYVYDNSGNLIQDPHKGLSIQYNFLNLPQRVQKVNINLDFTYDATGRKWQKKSSAGNRYYLNGIEYFNGKVESIHWAEGRLAAVYDQFGVVLQSYRSEYSHRDHLGNTRLTFSDLNNNRHIEYGATPSEIMQEEHYYPFGLNQVGDWYATTAPENKYQFNGKELNEEMGLNWTDYGARWYDATLGRWNVLDPAAESFSDWSVYSYAFNNPINMIDPNGAYPTSADSRISQNFYNTYFATPMERRQAEWDSQEGGESLPNTQENQPAASREDADINAYIVNGISDRLKDDKVSLLRALTHATDIYVKNGIDNIRYIILTQAQGDALSLKWYDVFIRIIYHAESRSGGAVTSTSGVPDKTNYVNYNYHELHGRKKESKEYGLGYLIAHETLHSLLHQTYFHYTRDYYKYNSQETTAHFNKYQNLLMDGEFMRKNYGGIPKGPLPKNKLHPAEHIIFEHSWWVKAWSYIPKN